ncbi:LOW QUALITY PROTEIN: uncharacterized protein B0I36DRAFT_378295 [Microdochium trichocladiopsis]|uniref:Uncharacterized protein n=1 Tax=Microdochium trichocladiopsis TaxID=1682393 RepID=A0A9P8XR20_9PEZI|nr:LOW QUALITY PROTEIN: uncharacterized protein B0I36DRAFT_378295 [Microdochium trichocladiopsis]KAH7012509.1 LOW QUALITY PROTEIN: hypothetical protein B0I36DRAFT_378295 [Microdochium trichocladiopsis]
MTSAGSSPRASYAEVARTPPTSQPDNVQTLSSAKTSPSTFTDSLFCTIDASHVEEAEKGSVTAGTVRSAVEKEMRARKEDSSWRCKAVTVDARNTSRAKIVCRNEEEHNMVKQAAEVATWVMAFGQENEATVAKISWLSRRNIRKAYGSMVVRTFSNDGADQSNAITAKRSGTRRSRAQSPSGAVFPVLQLNVGKRREVHDSVMNDGSLKDFAAIAIQEPPAWKAGDKLLTVPMGHREWTKMVPTEWREGRWGARSMLWGLDTEQVPIPSPDITAARVRLPDKDFLLISDYVPGGDPEALSGTCLLLDSAIRAEQRPGGKRHSEADSRQSGSVSPPPAIPPDGRDTDAARLSVPFMP